MKLQGAAGSDTRVYHVNIGVVLGTSTACVWGVERVAMANRKIPQAYEVRMPSENLSSCNANSEPVQPRTNKLMLFFFFTDTVDHHFPIILYENLIFPISLLQD